MHLHLQNRFQEQLRKFRKMKNHLLLLLIFLLIQSCATNDAIFELSPAQSRAITGLAAGQNAANNPYVHGTSLAKIKNIGANSFFIRVQDEGVIIELIKLNPEEEKNIVLLKGHQLYLDTDLKTKAKVAFEKYSR